MMKFASMGEVVVCAVNVILLLGVLTLPGSLGKSSSRGAVNDECSFVYDLAAELRSEGGGSHWVMEEMSFVNGDWVQDTGNAPILPFDDREISPNASVLPLRLVSFWVTDVDWFGRSERSMHVKGLLTMGITMDGSISDSFYMGAGGRQFDVWPGHTRLSISFEGVYVESSRDSGERVLCLSGSTTLPLRESNSHPWLWVKDPRYNHDQPPLLQDDRILLTIRFPMTFSLTSRVIRGELRSLNPKSSPKYFDPVHILSQLSKAASYEFASEKLLAKSCKPYPYKDGVLGSGIRFYNGSGFCQFIEEATRGQAFTVVPNWKCNGTDEFCSRLGPFSADESIRLTDGGFGDVKIYMQDIKCEQTGGQDNDPVSAKVAAVFRVVSPSENEYTAQGRTGPNNMTLTAEGFWKPSSGQLCMIGCRGVGNADGGNCDSRVCLYVPISFSIKQRSIVIGSFSSLNDETPSFFPLSFEKLVKPTELWNYLKTSRPYYRYSKIDSAGAILERYERFSFGSAIKKSLLQFPRLEDSESYLDSLSLLAEDLTLHTSLLGKSTPHSIQSPSSYIQMDIVSLGPLFGRYWSSINGSVSIIESENGESYHTKSVYTEKQLLLNVSAQLSLYPKQLLPESSRNFSAIYLEGLYDPHVGKMYLVGCRDIRASWEVLYESMDLEAGMDCLIEVVISYPPTTSRWLIDPTARISITSRRTVDDPLYSCAVNLRTFPIMYRQQREDILSHEGVEGILRVLTLSIAVVSIFSQLMYMNSEADSVPYVSVVMLGVQAFGYSLPLVIGAEAVFKKMSSRKSVDLLTYNLGKSQWIDVIDYVVKLLVLVAFLLTLRIVQRVRKSRSKSLDRAPREKPVLLASSAVHVIGFLIVVIVQAVKTDPKSGSLPSKGFVTSVGVSHAYRVWEVKLKEYVGVVHDLFLLPQVIGNFLWQIDRRPLRKVYYIGITVIRLLPHLYDYVTSSLSNPYVTEVHEFVDPSTDFFTRFGDVVIPLTAALLAAMVFIQQRWSYERLSSVLRFGKFGILPSHSRAYRRLTTKSGEAELVPGIDQGRAKPEDEDDRDD